MNRILLTGLLLPILTGCRTPETTTSNLRDDPDAVVEEIALESADGMVYGNLQPDNPALAACFMDGLVLPVERAVTLQLNGSKFSFCSGLCRDQFAGNPASFIAEARHPVIGVVSVQK